MGAAAADRKAVQLTAEQCALLSPPGGNTKPVPERTAAALAKARKRTTEDMAAKALRGVASADDVKRASEALDAEEAAAKPKPGVEMVFLQKDSPEAIDKTLRWKAREFDKSWEQLETQIVRAKAAEIHTALGFKSWPDYIADVASHEMPNVARSVDDRRQVVALLAGEGMSNRAIADAVGVNDIMVRRDKHEVRHNVAPEATAIVCDVIREPGAGTAISDVDRDALPVTGRDGKQYPPSLKPRRITDDDKRRFELDEIARRAAALYGKTIALHEQMQAWEARWRYTEYAYELEQIGCISDHLTQMQNLLAEMSSPTKVETR